MYGPEYPEWGRREAMLWAIHEWVQNRPPGEDMLTYVQVATLVGGGEYVDPTNQDPDKQDRKKFHAEQLRLFVTLVNEGLIDADDPNPMNGPVPFTRIKVRGLTERGLQLIRELPNPKDALLGRLDDLTAAIRGLQDVPPEDRNVAEQLVEELKGFARRLAPAAALKLLAVLDKVEGG
jgi:hypothetical protein